jgi:hypothetical protein
MTRQVFRQISSFLILLALAPAFSVAQEPAKPAKAPRPIAAPVPITGDPPATILIFRHAEKLTDGQIHLPPAGFKRADRLRDLFVPPGKRPDLPTPQVIFATHASAHSDRPVETVTPLAQALHLPIDSSISNDDYAGLARTLLSGKYAGKVVLIAWHHGTIPSLVISLGAKPPVETWPDEQFDRVWRIDYVDGKATIKDLPQHLMPGDSN